VSQPRFLFLTTSSGSVGPSVVWRLVAGNNHALGRGPAPFAELESCMEAVTDLRERVHVASSGLSPDSRPGRWGWQVTHLDEVLAVSSRVYERQREARYSLEQFLIAVPVATEAPPVAVRTRSRDVRRSEPLPSQRSGVAEATR
jgi:hypothetical protein